MPGWIVETITTPTPATVGVTGGTPTITATQNAVITPEPVELVITGGQPLSGPVAVPSGAALMITGGTPTVTQDRLLTPGALNLTITGGQPSVVKNTIITPTKASLTVTSGTPTVTNQPPSAYDTSVNGNGNANTISNFTITAAVGADIFVAVSWDRSAIGATSVTCGGTAMTEIAFIAHDNTANNGTLRLYRLAGAGDGTAKTISVTVSGIAYYTASAISFTAVPTTLNPVTSYGSSTTASQSVTLTGPIGLYVLSAGASGPTNYTSFSGMTNRTSVSSIQTRLLLNTVAASGTVSATSSGTNKWAGIFVSF